MHNASQEDLAVKGQRSPRRKECREVVRGLSAWPQGEQKRGEEDGEKRTSAGDHEKLIERKTMRVINLT